MSFNDIKKKALDILFGAGAPSALNDLEYAYYQQVIDGGGGPGTVIAWTPTERLTPLIVDEVVSNCTLATVGGNTQITQTSTAAVGRARTNATCFMQVGIEYGVYFKLINPDDGQLGSTSDMAITLANYANPNYTITNFVQVLCVKEVDDTWGIQVGGQGSGTDYGVETFVPDVNFHEAEVCVTFTIVNATDVIVNFYANGVLNNTNTVTLERTSHLNCVHVGIHSASATPMVLDIVASPATPITGVTQLQLTGEVDETAYPAGCENKTYIVTGLDYNLLAITANKVISNGCLVAFDSNGDLVTSTSDANEVNFYVDWTNEEVYIQNGDTTWSDGVAVDTLSPSGLFKLNSTSLLTIAAILTPNGDKLSNYEIVWYSPVIYVESGWKETGFISYTPVGAASVTGRGVRVTRKGADSLFAATGNGSVTVTGGPGVHGMSATGTSVNNAYCKILIHARK